MSCSSQSPPTTVDVVPLEIPRGAVVSFMGVVEKYILNPTTLRWTLSRADLTGALIELTVRRKLDDEEDSIVIYKSSLNVADIEILPQVVLSVDQATKGLFKVTFHGADTEELEPTCCYVYDIWVTLADGTREPVIDVSPFCVAQRSTPVEDTPDPTPPPAAAAPQTPQERSFRWTVPTTGVSWVVTIPLGGAMRDTSYGVWPAVEDPIFPAAPGGWVPSATKTTTTFVYNSNEELQAGSILVFFLRDL